MSGLGYPSGAISIIPESLITSPNAVVSGKLKPWWQTGLALNAGDSGGPIFGPKGNVIGVAEAMRDSAQLISYVIPLQFGSGLLASAGATTVPEGPCAEHENPVPVAAPVIKIICTGEFESQCAGPHGFFYTCGYFGSDDQLASQVCGQPSATSLRLNTKSGNRCGYALIQATCH